MNDANLPTSSFADSLIDESPDALLAISIDGRVLAWNRGAEVIFGFTAEEAVGQLLEQLVIPEDQRAQARQALWDVIAKGTVLLEAARRRKDGTTIQVDSTMRLVAASSARPSFIAVVRKTSRS